MRTRFLLSLSLVAGVVAAGTVGYFGLWRGAGGTWPDALFMTIITITTIIAVGGGSAPRRSSSGSSS